MAIESACIPIPSEIIMPLAGWMLVKDAGLPATFCLIAGAFGALGCTIASPSISSSPTPRYSMRRRGTTSRSPICAAVSARAWVSTNPTTTSTPRARRLMRLDEHAIRLADAGRRADVQFELPALALAHEREEVGGGCLPGVVRHVGRRHSEKVRDPEAGGQLGTATRRTRRWRGSGRSGLPGARARPATRAR